MTLILVSLFILYIFFLLALLVGWDRAIKSRSVATKSFDTEPLISVIIPARNEEHTIGFLLEDLRQQRYTNFEVIIADDHSQDKTKEVVQRYLEKDSRFHLLESQGQGKKRALAAGMSISKGAVIVTTDADCHVTIHWLEALSGYFRDGNIKMIFGGVKMYVTSFFSKLQSLEFASLIGSGGAIAGLGMPTLCNGANLAFRKFVYEEVGGYDGNFNIPSGDDEFLMRKILKRYPHGVKFAPDPQTVVTTSPNKDLGHFLQQRIRWAGKWRHTQSFFGGALAIFIFCFQSATIFLPLFILMQWINPIAALLLWFIKVMLEFFFLLKISRFLGISWSWPAFLFLQFIYPFYTVIIGFTSNFLSFEWKGRKLNSLTVSNN